MKRRILALALCATLCLTPALAVDVETAFPQRNEYPGYTDVAPEAWYAPYAKLCYETGLITGTTGTTFSPETTMTVAQAVTLAVRIEDLLSGGDGVLDQSGPAWYSAAVDRGLSLAQAAGDLRLASRLAQPDSPATRQDFFSCMVLVIPDELLTPINAVTTLPDTDDSQIIAYYNAGILSGMDSYGSFQGNLTLRRCEAAAMAARLARSALRQSFTLTPLPQLCQAAGVLPETVFFQGNTSSVTALTYLEAAAARIQELETLCAGEGMDFNWNNTIDGQSFLLYVTDGVMAGLGVAKDQATPAYRAFDIQVFYSRLLDLQNGQAQ